MRKRKWTSFGHEKLDILVIFWKFKLIIVVRDEHPRKQSDMLVTALSIQLLESKVVRDEHPRKQDPMMVTALSIQLLESKVVRDEHPEKQLGMLVTALSTQLLESKVVRDEHPEKQLIMRVINCNLLFIVQVRKVEQL